MITVRPGSPQAEALKRLEAWKKRCAARLDRALFCQLAGITEAEFDQLPRAQAEKPPSPHEQSGQ